MKNGLIWVWATGLVFCGIGCGDSASQPPLPTFNFDFEEEEEEESQNTEGGESEDGAEDVLEETSEDGEAVDEDAAGGQTFGECDDTDNTLRLTEVRCP